MDDWRSWSSKYEDSTRAEQERMWSALTEEQRNYVTGELGLKPPPPAPPSWSPARKASLIGCLGLLGGLLFFGWCVSVITPDRDQTPTWTTSSSERSPASLPSSAEAPPSRQQPMVYAKNAGVNVRQGPGANHAVVGQAGRRLEAFAYETKEGEWFKIGDGKYIHESVVLTSAEKERLDRADLHLLSWTWSADHGWVTAEGQVRNASDRNLKNVAAVVTWYDRSGNIITSDSAVIEYNPILPGQTSPFKVMARHNPAMQKAGIDFKYLIGGSIEWVKLGD